MDRTQLTAKELKRRYQAGERNFAGVDLSGESLRGMRLREINLREADLSNVDLRSTDLRKAYLAKAKFISARAGSRRLWLFPQLVTVFLIVASASFLSSIFWTGFAISTLAADSFITGTKSEDALFDIVGFSLFLLLIGLIYIKSALEKSGISLSALVVSGCAAFAFALTFVFAGTDTVSIVSAFAFAFASAFSIAIAGSFAGIFSATISGALPLSIIGALGGAGTFAFAFLLNDSLARNFIFASAAAKFLVNLTVFSVTFNRAFDEKVKDELVRNIGVWVGSWGSTNFSEADLSEASFATATLKNSHFYRSLLMRTEFSYVNDLNFVRSGSTILSDPNVRTLLTTLDGSNQSYAGVNLKGAYLAGANLSNTNLTEADISQADLSQADLTQANLTKTQALGTHFCNADFTGATLEAWNIDSTTRLQGAFGKYVYLMKGNQERRPNSGEFGSDEFAKLFQEVLDTVNLIFQNGIDWKAFTRTFSQVLVQYENTELSIQSIENKGDGVVVVKLNAPPPADKRAIHKSFTETYQLALQEAEARYKAQINAKDEQIASYRQQSADMQEVVKMLSQRPINVTATAESTSMQDNSRNISVGGNVTNSALSTGDHNTQSVSVSLPPPESVNIHAELAALQRLLQTLGDPVTDAYAAKLHAEAQKPEPDKTTIGTTLETGLTYARNLQGFAAAMDGLRPHVQSATAWLGEHWYKLLGLVGLTP